METELAPLVKGDNNNNTFNLEVPFKAPKVEMSSMYMTVLFR